ncbi:MAG: selenium metabolism-associated LysR family transcriptional regulator [Lachnospiraceae bacterium]|nr:selenium metabolism-associated LysR family transcriptional regulator [Lachnospiraceae bacterium]
MTEFTLKQLEIFAAIVEYGSFSRAAEELFLTQSTVSTHILALEKVLGEPLFDRSFRRQTKLTHAGEQLFPAAKRVLSACEEIPVLFRKPEVQKPLPIGASTVPGQYLLPEYLSAYLEEEKDFRYLLRRGDSLDVHRMLLEGEIRIGFVGVVSEPEAVEYHPIAEDRLVMVTPNNERYRNLQEQGLRGRDLLGEPTIAREIGSGTDRAAQNYMRSIGFSPRDLHIVARMDEPEAIKHMVANGAGVSILSSLAVAQEVQSGSLLSFEMDRSGLRRAIYMITLREGIYSQEEQKLISFIKERSQRIR